MGRDIPVAFRDIALHKTIRVPSLFTAIPVLDWLSLKDQVRW